MKQERVYIPSTDNTQVALDTYVTHVSNEIDPDIRRPAILVCPGGGYAFCSEREAEPVALRFAALGFNTFVYIALGFLAGLIAYEPEDVRARRRPSRVYLRRALTFFAMALMREVVIYAYQYFGTARIEGIYFLNLLIRTLLATALCMLLGPLEARLTLGRGARYRRTSAKREVKSF